jgi:hypothetical protein
MLKIGKRPSANGYGIFAKMDIKAGELVLEWKGSIIYSYAKAKSFSEEDWNHMVQFGNERYLNPRGIGRFVNHSCEPNGWVRIEGNRLFLVALRNIKKGEEVTFDYSTTMDEDDWEMDCRCGSKNCRERIRDFKYLPKKLRERYIRLKIVPEYAINSAMRKPKAH